jgi:hypothetical protein
VVRALRRRTPLHRTTSDRPYRVLGQRLDPTTAGLALTLAVLSPGCDPAQPPQTVVSATQAVSTRPADEGATGESARTPSPQRLLSIDETATTANTRSGGLVDLLLRPADREQPFIGEPALRGDLRALWISSLPGSTRLVATALVDALAPAGPLALSLTLRDRSHARTTLYAPPPDAPHPPWVTSRPATPLLVGATLRGETLATPRASNLYRLNTAADDQVLVLRYTTSGSLLGFALGGAVAPGSGRFAAGEFFYASIGVTSSGSGSQTALAWLPGRGDQYVATFAASLGGGADYVYDLTALLRPGTRRSAVESSPPDAPATPLLSLTLDGAYVGEGAALDRAGDVDYIRLTAPRDLRVYVKATIPAQGLGGSTGLGVAVALTGGDCKTPLAAARPVQQEAAIASGGTACAVISSPAGYVGPYALIIAAEAP